MPNLYAIRDAYNDNIIAAFEAESEEAALSRYLDLEQLGEDRDAWYINPNGHHGMVVTNYEVYAARLDLLKAV